MRETGPDREVLRRRIQFVRESVQRLESIRREGRDRFLASDVLQAAATRHLQVAIEALLDAGNHIIAREQLGLPSTYAEIMEILVDRGILPSERKGDLVNMVRFRNRAVHLYDEILPAEVWTIMETHLGDFESVITALVERYF